MLQTHNVKNVTPSVTTVCHMSLVGVGGGRTGSKLRYSRANITAACAALMKVFNYAI